MPLNWLLFFGISICILIISTLTQPIINYFVEKYKIYDHPDTRPDKNHRLAIPLMGGVTVVLTALITSIILWTIKESNFYDLKDYLGSNITNTFELPWILVSIFILLVGGILDDKFGLRGRWLFLYINLSVIIAITLGRVHIDNISQPLAAYIPNLPYIQSILSYIWLMFCIAATKFIDGHDGLSSSFSLIGLLTIACISLQTNNGQPLIFFFALIWAFSILPFLLKNFPDASQYLGEAGSEVLGFSIGILSILSGAKIATAYTLLGWFMLDILFVFLIRFSSHQNILTPDRNHWHHRLLDMGLSKIQVLVLTVLILLLSAHMGLLLPDLYKLLIIPVQIVFLVCSYLLNLVIKQPTEE